MPQIPEIFFSEWIRWRERSSLDNISFSGVYLLAHFDDHPKLIANHLNNNVIYIGETCAQQLRKRLNDFHRCAIGKADTHSGGVSYWKQFGVSAINHLYVAIFPVANISSSLKPLFIRYVERKLLFEYAIEWGKAPLLNKK